MMITVFSYRL